MGYVPEDTGQEEVLRESGKAHGRRTRKKAVKHQGRRREEDEWGDDWGDRGD